MTVNLINDETTDAPIAAPDKEAEIEEMMRQNLELTKEIHEMTRKIKNYITFQKVMSFIYLILIVGPIILSVIYLPTILSNYLGQYQDLLGGAGVDSDILKDLQGGKIKVPDSVIEKLKR